MIQHVSPISGVTTYGSKWVATAGYDNQVILWNADKKEAIARANHDHLVNSCNFSADGKWLATASSDHTARIFSVPDLKLVAVCAGHADDVEMAVFNKDATQVATASRDKIIRVFSRSGRLEREMKGHQADVLSIAFGFDDETLVSTSDDGTIRRWSIAGDELDMIDLQGVETDTLVITSSGLIIAGNDEGQIVFLGNGSQRRYDCHKAGIKRLVLDEARRRLISVSYDRTCKIWRFGDSMELDLLCEFPLPNVIWPRSCAFLGTQQVVFGTFGSSYASYDFDSGRWDFRNVEDTNGKNAASYHEGCFYSIGDSGALFRNGTAIARFGSLCNFILPVNGKILTGGQSGEVFEGFSGKVIFHHTSPLNCGAKFNSQGTVYAIIGTYTGEILLFRVPSPETVHHASGCPFGDSVEFVKAFKIHQNAIKGIAASETEIFSVSANREAARITIKSLLSDDPKASWVESKAHHKIANGCCDLGLNRFASVSRDLKLRIWESGHGDVICFDSPHTHSIKCISADPTGQYIATGSYNGVVAIFNTGSSSWIHVERPTTCGISSLCATPAGFAASSYDGKIYEIPFS